MPSIMVSIMVNGSQKLDNDIGWLWEQSHSISIPTVSVLTLRKPSILGQNCRFSLIWMPPHKKTVSWGWMKAINWGPALWKPWFGWKKDITILRQHLYTCWTCYNTEGQIDYQLIWSDSAISEPPPSIRKQYVEGERRPSIMVHSYQNLVML